MSKDRRPLRVLHVVGSLNRGGIETWLLHVARNIDWDQCRMDFIVHSTAPGAYDERMRACGARVFSCLRTERPWVYHRNFRRIVERHGPYDVLHSHVDMYSGVLVWSGKRTGLRMRIAHGHNDTRDVESRASASRQCYLRLMRRSIKRCATHGLAASRQAAVAMFGADWEQDPRWRLLSYGIPLAPFEGAVDRVSIRRDLGIAEDAVVVGHVGRFSEQKNHAFLVRVAAEVLRQEPGGVLLMVGNGPLESAVREMVARAGIASRTIFAGSRDDVPQLMRGAMDVFLFPSHYEGLGIVVVEAQASGLPCVIADVVPREADVVPELVRRLSLRDSATAWAAAVLRHRAAAVRIDPGQALAAISNSVFNIDNSVAQLERVYAGRG